MKLNLKKYHMTNVHIIGHIEREGKQETKNRKLNDLYIGKKD